jgi:hypothetical protein
MAITYTWSIDSLPNYPNEDGEADVVFQINWTLTGTDSTYTASEKGSTGLEFDSSAPFTPYSQLTKDQIIGWITSIMLEETLNLYKGWIADNIARQKNQQIIPLPWSN